MRIANRYRRFGLVLLISLMTGYGSQVMSMTTDGEKPWNDLYSADLQKRRDVLQYLEKLTDKGELEKAGKALIAIIEDENASREFEGTRHLAIKAACVIKAKVTIPSLIKVIDFYPKGIRVEERLPTEMFYPAAVSLVCLGDAAVEALKKHLVAGRMTDPEKKLAVWVLLKVLGKQTAIAQLSEMETQHAGVAFGGGEALSDYLSAYRPSFSLPPIK